MGSVKPTLRETAMQLIISICALAAVAFASDPYAPPAPYHPAPAPYPPAPAPYHPAPAPYHPAPAPYHAPAPAPYHPAPYVEEAPKNYQFGYDVHGYDEYGNPNVHSRTEARDGPTVKGQYRVELPDCRTQIVDYFVDEYKQYHADVKYEGEICPDKSLIHHKAPYAPAPAPYHAPAPYAPAPAPYHAPVVHHPVAHAPLVHHAVAHAPVVHHPVAHAPLVHAPLVHAPVGLAHVSTPFVHHG